MTWADIKRAPSRDKLREQNALSEEIVNAITGNTIGEPIDDDELEAELEGMQQEQLDEQMLKTGSVPVSDQIQRVPAVPAGDSKSYYTNHWYIFVCTNDIPQSRARHQLQPTTTKRKSCASCRRRWPCKPPHGGDRITSTSTEHNNDLIAWSGQVVKLQREEDGSDEKGSGDPSMEADFVSSVLRLRLPQLSLCPCLALAYRGCILTCEGKTEGIVTTADYLIQVLNHMIDPSPAPFVKFLVLAPLRLSGFEAGCDLDFTRRVCCAP